MASMNKILIWICILNFALFSQTNGPNLLKLSKDADLIVTGKVVVKKSEWNSDKTRILTRVTVKVDEFLKSIYQQKEIVVVHPGGEVGEIGELYSHTPKFTKDEEVLLFLKKDKKANFRVLQGEEGKMTLYEDQKSGEKITSSNKKLSTIKSEIKKSLEGERN